LGQGQPVPAVERNRDGVAFLMQGLAQKFRQLAFVFDDQNPHRLPPS
jgi:hypothetical protein